MRVIFGCFLYLCCFGALPTYAGSVDFVGIIPGQISVKVVSLEEARFRTTVRQQFDFSCGSAALATLLTYHYAHPVTERAVFQAMYAKGDQKKIRREGFSMLDMKNYLESIGYNADGYKASLTKLAQAGIPAIVLVKDHGYNHFVVIKGVADGKVLVGDPAAGIKVMPRSNFDKMWTNGILFVVSAPGAQDNFNLEKEWQTRARAPLGEAVTHDILTNIELLRPGPNDF